MNSNPIVAFESQETGFLATVQTDSIVSNSTIHEFKRELREYINAHPGTVLHLDLSNVRRFSCAVLSDLLHTQQELDEKNGALRLSGIHGNVRTIMRITGMTDMFTLEHRQAHS